MIYLIGLFTVGVENLKQTIGRALKNYETIKASALTQTSIKRDGNILVCSVSPQCRPYNFHCSHKLQSISNKSKV